MLVDFYLRNIVSCGAAGLRKYYVVGTAGGHRHVSALGRFVALSDVLRRLVVLVKQCVTYRALREHA